MGFLLYSAQWAAQGIIVSATGLLSLRSSQSLLASLTTFGTGRLIGASVVSFFYSVFVVAAYAIYAPGSSSPRFSPAAFSISHIAGILLMLVADRSLSSHTLDTSRPAALMDSSDAVPPSIDAAQAEDAAAQPLLASQTTRSFGLHRCRIYLFTFAFVLQEMAGGISFDYGSTAPTWLPSDDQHTPSLAGTLKRFLPELVGEAATALGFATTLLAASLPIAECKRRVLLYAAARPLCAFLAYSVATLSRTTPASHWPPIIIIYSFTTGLVVYATFVVRPSIVNSRATTARLSQLATVSLMAAGAFLPYILSVAVTLVPVGGHSGTPIGRDTAGAGVAY